MKPRHPIAGLDHRPTIPAAEARAQLALVAAVITTTALVIIFLIVSAA